MNSIVNDLQPGFSIFWYEIKSVLGRGGFGITYLARDNNLGHQVAIKEYLPRDFATRSGDSTVQPVSIEQRGLFDWGLERFMSEAKTLARFKHPNIVRVSSVFMHNNTGYMVMDYEQGEVLSHVYKCKKKLTQKALENIYYPIIHGLSSVHKEGFIHRDIKPANIYIRADGSPVLIDFGAARQSVGVETEKFTTMLSVGYAPFEQYNESPEKQGAWTDIYALGASMYQGVTGEKPVESSVRGMALLHNETDPYEPLSAAPRPAGYSRSFLRAIDKALMIQVQDRPQTLNEFLAMLKGDIALPDLFADASLSGFSGGSLSVKEPAIGSLSAKEPNIGSFCDIAAPDLFGDDSISLFSGGSLGDDSLSHFSGGALGDVSLSDLSGGSLGDSALPVLSDGSLTDIEPTMILKKAVIRPRNDKFPEMKAERPGPVIGTAEIEKTTKKPLFSLPGILIITVTIVVIVLAFVPLPDLIQKQDQQSMDNKDLVSTDEEVKTISPLIPMLEGLSEAQQKVKHLLGTENQSKQIEGLLDKAEIALGKGHVYEPEQENAIFYYQNVIQLDQNNVTARAGLSDISDKLIVDAQNEITRKRLTNAEKLIALAETITPESPSIKKMREKVQRSTQLEQLLAKADTAYKNNHLLVPGNDNAYLFYKKVLSLAPSNLTARGRLSRIAGFYASKVRKNTLSGSITLAKKNLAILKKYFPDYSELSGLKSGLARKETRIKNAEKTSQNLVAANTFPAPEINKAQDHFQRKPWITNAEKTNQNLVTANTFLPLGINQKQDDFLVVQDIVGKFMESFRSMDMGSMLKVSRLTNQQHALYFNIFNSYQSLKITVVPNTFKLTKEHGTGSVKFEISDLVDDRGRPVSSDADWMKIEVKITRRADNWLKIEII